MPDIILATKEQLDAHSGDNVSHNTATTCSTTASTTAKVVTSTEYTLSTNARITVKFTYANTATAPTLNVNATGAKRIFINGEASNGTTNTWSAGDIIEFIYDGTYWQGFSAKLAKQYGNNVKSSAVNALLSIDNSLPLTSSSTWNDFITQIGNIKTGYLSEIMPGGGAIYNDLTTVSSKSTTPIKIREVKMNISGIVRVSFSMRNGTSYVYCYGQVYKNGVAVGTEFVTNNGQMNAITYTQDIDVAENDLVQVYLRVQLVNHTAFSDSFSIGVNTDELITKVV